MANDTYRKLTHIGASICSAANAFRKPEYTWRYECEFLEYSEDENGVPHDCQFIVNAKVDPPHPLNGKMLDEAAYWLESIANAISAAFNAVMCRPCSGWHDSPDCWYVQDEPNWFDFDGEYTEDDGVGDEEIGTVQYPIFLN